MTTNIEAALNYLFLSESKCLAKIHKLKTEYFKDPTQKSLFKFISDKYNKGVQVDMIIIGSEWNEGEETISNWLEAMSGYATPLLIDDYISELLRHRYNEKLSVLVAEEQDGNIDKEQFREKLSELDSEFSSSTEKSTVSSRDLAISTLENILDESVKKIEIGFPEIDKVLNITPGSMFVLAARPSTGKTALTVQAMINSCKKGYAVGLLSLEMDEQDIMKRVYATVSGISYKSILDKKLTEEQIKKLQEAMEEVGTFKFFVNSEPNMSIFRLKEVAKAMVVANKVDVIFIDYLGLIQGDRRKGIYENVTFVSKQIKQIARELSIPIIILAQLNRDIEKRSADSRPMLSDLRDSGAIEQDADIIAMLHRTDEEDGLVEFLIRKNRNGPLMKVDMKFNRKIQRFEEFNF